MPWVASRFSLCALRPAVMTWGCSTNSSVSGISSFCRALTSSRCMRPDLSELTGPEVDEARRVDGMGFAALVTGLLLVVTG